jgi:hypothetical protein
VDRESSALSRPVARLEQRYSQKPSVVDPDVTVSQVPLQQSLLVLHESPVRPSEHPPSSPASSPVMVVPLLLPLPPPLLLPLPVTVVVTQDDSQLDVTQSPSGWKSETPFGYCVAHWSQSVCVVQFCSHCRYPMHCVSLRHALPSEQHEPAMHCAQAGGSP